MSVLGTNAAGEQDAMLDENGVYNSLGPHAAPTSSYSGLQSRSYLPFLAPQTTALATSETEPSWAGFIPPPSLSTPSENAAGRPPNASTADLSMLGADENVDGGYGMFGPFPAFNEPLHGAYFAFPSQSSDGLPPEFIARRDTAGPFFVGKAGDMHGLAHPSNHMPATWPQQPRMNWSQRIDAIGSVSAVYFQLDRHRQDFVSIHRRAHRAMASTMAASDRASDDIVGAVFREVVAFCESIVSTFDAILAPSGVDQQPELFAMITMTLMTINHFVDMHEMILAGCGAAVDSAVTALSRPSPASQTQSPERGPADVGNVDPPGLFAVGVSQPLSKPSVLSIPLPHTETTSHPLLTKLMRLDTMDFNVTHLQAICQSLQTAAERLDPDRNGHDVSTTPTPTPGSGRGKGVKIEARANELIYEIERTQQRISAFQREVAQLSEKLKAPILVVEGTPENGRGDKFASKS